MAPYRDYRFQLGEAMYASLGITREHKAQRLQWFARNYQFFGAPMALFCSDRPAHGVAAMVRPGHVSCSR